ncbi:coenzyme F420-0:L-glutamate ligase [Candidatus Daviesbacteria bacterium]|nr:coenzyme F420-0:L-glutamate ligase [Candidatus Daviesbacteria bacterium]
MIVSAIRSRKFLPPKDNLWDLFSEISFKENSILAVTSKVVAIGEGRCIPVDKITKDRLAIRESDKYLPRKSAPSGLVMHTIKNNMMIASAGVDESNGKGYYILWPKDPQASAKKIWQFLTKKFKVKNLGVIITDSRLVPLRRGVVGVAIGYFGFKPLRDYRGKKDLFGRKFKMETSNLPDSLASAAVLEMGEGAEQTPLAVISDIPYIKFSPTFSNIKIPEKEDMFYPLLSAVKWKRGGSGKSQ